VAVALLDASALKLVVLAGEAVARAPAGAAVTFGVAGLAGRRENPSGEEVVAARLHAGAIVALRDGAGETVRDVRAVAGGTAAVARLADAVGVSKTTVAADLTNAILQDVAIITRDHEALDQNRTAPHQRSDGTRAAERIVEALYNRVLFGDDAGEQVVELLGGGLRPDWNKERDCSAFTGGVSLADLEVGRDEIAAVEGAEDLA
jgi:hypothetical protein